MAVRTYIGARYVPRFMGTLDPTQQYEALDVVDNGSGTTYIAKKIVPPGTPLTDTDYWALYGASSGAIVQLQNDMIAAQNDILGLQGDITTLEAADEHLYSLMQDLKNHNVIIVSDSYGDGAGEWPDVLAGYAGWDAAHYHNQSVSGSSFYGNAGVGPHFIEQIQNYSGDRDAITDIIVAGGINDSYYDSNNTSLNQAIADFISYAKTNYPNATVWIGYIGHILQSSPHLNGRTYAMLAFTCRTYYYNATLNGANILNNVEYALSPIKTALSADGLHPSNTGATLIAKAVFEALTVGSAKCNWPAWGDSLFKYQVNNELSYIYRDTPSSFYFEVATIGQAWTKASNIALSALYFNAPVFWSAQSMLLQSNVTPGGGTYAGRNLMFKFEGDGVYVKSANIKTDGTGYETINPAAGQSVIKVYPQEMNVPFLTNMIN